MTTKPVFVVFDGKAFVPEDASDIPVGAKGAFDVEIDDEPTSPRKGERIANALAGRLTHDQADEMLAAIDDRFGRVDPPPRDPGE
ncbi:MAG TPA: hypothetical protein VF624_11260 [Tepidisphaeraceae bacterium]|jgi:hypothetical protein